jgi:D-alanine-D-alanine ligase
MSSQGSSRTARCRRVCVLSGGPTLEASASRISAAAVFAALESEDYEVLWLDLDEKSQWRRRGATVPMESCERSDQRLSTALGRLEQALLEAGAEVVFPVMHGIYGEDGQIQRLCRRLSIPCVGCDEAASARCYDKVRFKQTMTPAGLPVASFLSIDRDQIDSEWGLFAGAVEQQLGFPCIVKPSRSGSSIGLSRVADHQDLTAARDRALAFDRTVVAEQLFTGIDVEIGVCESGVTVVGTPVELEFEGSLYDFEAKYARGDRRYMPARCSKELLASLRATAASAFCASGCRGMARVDLLVEPVSGAFVVNEINTIPYMPESSTFTHSICDRTKQSYSELIASFVQLASR